MKSFKIVFEILSIAILFFAIPLYSWGSSVQFASLPIKGSSLSGDQDCICSKTGTKDSITYANQTFESIDFRNKDINGYSFKNSNLLGCKFDNTRIENVDFSGASFGKDKKGILTSFTNAHLKKCNYLPHLKIGEKIFFD